MVVTLIRAFFLQVSAHLTLLTSFRPFPKCYSLSEVFPYYSKIAPHSLPLLFPLPFFIALFTMLILYNYILICFVTIRMFTQWEAGIFVCFVYCWQHLEQYQMHNVWEQGRKNVGRESDGLRIWWWEDECILIWFYNSWSITLTEWGGRDG